MTPSLNKRFWTSVTISPVENGSGYQILLDERVLRTPAKAPLVVPTKALADMIAQEWEAQEEDVDPLSMPATRAANAAIDKVAANFDTVVEMLGDYGASDLICYRATDPEGLVSRQAAAWDPLLVWCGKEFDAPLNVTSGVIYVEQPDESVRKLRAQLQELTPFELAGMHDLITLSGSLVIALAVSANHLTLEQAWGVSRIDEDWQKEKWGVDEEAEAAADQKEREFQLALKFYNASNSALSE